jgi:hypothetical protein
MAVEILNPEGLSSHPAYAHGSACISSSRSIHETPSPRSGRSGVSTRRRPSWSGSPGLARPDALVEIEAFAVV